MHPALSVIFFTVTAGAGYGLLVLLCLSRLVEFIPIKSPLQLVAFGIIGLVLVTLGLVSSTFHLANPKNAWRSFARFKTSWLSREAVFAVLFYPVCIAWLMSEWLELSIAPVLAILTALLAVVVLVCTAMIYASLKTIRQWNNALTPVVFVFLGIMLGAVVLVCSAMLQGIEVNRLVGVTLSVIAFSAIVKVAYFIWIGQPAGPSINTALGFTRATVQLLDVGHTADTFLTKEFGFQVAKTKLIWLRILCLFLAFILPALLLSGFVVSVTAMLAVLALVFCYAGVFIERWLFFAEARHVVNLYHGAQRT